MIAAGTNDFGKVRRREMRACFSTIASLSLSWLLACGHAETVTRSPADRQYAFAQELYRQGFFDLAADEFAKFAEDYPEEPRREAAVFYAAQSLFQSGSEQREAALAALDAYQKEYSDSRSQFYHTSFYLVGEAHFQKAEELAAAGAAEAEGALPEEARQEYDRALTAYLRCAELWPGQSEVVATALSRAGYCATRLGNWAQAGTAYQALADRHQSVRAQFMVGEVLYRWGATNPEKLADAINAYEKVTFFGDNALEDDAAVGVAWCLYKQGSLDDCRQYLEKQIAEGLFSRIDRDFQQEVSRLPDASYLLGLCSTQLGDDAEAVKWFRLLSKYPECPLRRDGLARLGKLLGGNVDPSTEEGAEISYAMGRSLMEDGKPSEAAAELERLYRSYPKTATAVSKDQVLYDWGTCYERLGYYREAVAILGHLSLNSADATMRGKAARAKATCHRELAREATDPAVRNSEEIDAIVALKRYADNASGREAEDVLGSVGDFYYRREMYARAQAVYEAFLSRFPLSPRRAEVLLLLGRCLMEARPSSARAREAIPVLEQCRRDYPSGREAVLATEHLAAMFVRLSEYERALVEYSRLEPESFPGLSEKERESCRKVFEDAAHAQGLIRERMGDVPGAVSELELFLLQYPESQKAGEVRLRLARLYSEKGRHEDSVRVLRPYFEEGEKCPDLESALVTLVGSLLKLGRSADAMEQIREVLNSPEGAGLPPSAFGRLSRIMEEGAQREGARLPYLLLIERQRKLHRAMTSAAANTREMIEKRQYARAVHYCRDILLIHVPEAASERKADVASEESPTRENALSYLRRLEETGNSAKAVLRTALWELAELNLRLGAPGVAAETFESLAAINPPTKQHFDVLFKAGSAWKEAGELQKALRDFEEIVRSSSEPADNLRGQLAIGDLWLDSGDARRSLGTYLRIIHFYDPENPATRPWVARALFQSGLAFEKLKRMEDAKRQFQTLMRDFDDEKALAPLLQDARRHLERMKTETKAPPAPSS